MVDFELVVSTIENRIGSPFIVNMEDGYITWVSSDARFSVVFCNWDIYGDSVSSQCEVRIDTSGTQEICERIVLNGMTSEEAYDAVDALMDIAVGEYGF